MEKFEIHLRAQSMLESSIRTRLAHIRTLALSSSTTPQQISADELITWAGQRRWARETRHAYYDSLRQFFTLIRPGDNPASNLPRIRRPVGTPRPTPEKVFSDALLRADARTRAILILAGYAGLRRSEIACVRLDDLAFNGVTWELEVHGKGAKTRIIPIAPSVAAVIRLRCQSEESEWAFPSRGGTTHLTPGHISKLASRVLPPQWSLHTLRHRFATVAYAAESNILAVRDLLGHANVATTQRYTRVTNESLAVAANYAAGPRRSYQAPGDMTRREHRVNGAGQAIAVKR